MCSFATNMHKFVLVLLYTTQERLLQNFKQKNPTLIIFSNFEVKLKNKITENMPCYLGFCYKTKTL